MPAPEILSISDLKKHAVGNRVEAAVHGQVESLQKKSTKEGKPFWEVTLADAEAKLTLRAWSDGPAFGLCEELAAGAFIEAAGEFVHNGTFGLDAKRWSCRVLSEEERDSLLAGSPALQEKQAADFALIEATVAAL